MGPLLRNQKMALVISDQSVTVLANHPRKTLRWSKPPKAGALGCCKGQIRTEQRRSEMVSYGWLSTRVLKSQLQTENHQERTKGIGGVGQAVHQPLALCLPESRLIPGTAAKRTESQCRHCSSFPPDYCPPNTPRESSKIRFPSLLKLFLFRSLRGPEDSGKAKEGRHRPV